MSAGDWVFTGVVLLPIVLLGAWFAGTLLIRAATARPVRAPSIGTPPRWQGPPSPHRPPRGRTVEDRLEAARARSLQLERETGLVFDEAGLLKPGYRENASVTRGHFSTGIWTAPPPPLTANELAEAMQRFNRPRDF